MIYVMAHEEARRRAVQAVEHAPEGWVIKVEEPKRNSIQNNLLHAMLTEIACTCEWAGRRWDVESWKRLLCAAWVRAVGGKPIVVPSLENDGNFEVLYRRTSQLTKAECSDLISFIEAWYAQNAPEKKGGV